MAASTRGDIRPKKDKNGRLLNLLRPHQLVSHREQKSQAKDCLKSPVAGVTSVTKSPSRYSAHDSPSKDDMQVYLIQLLIFMEATTEMISVFLSV